MSLLAHQTFILMILHCSYPYICSPVGLHSGRLLYPFGKIITVPFTFPLLKGLSVVLFSKADFDYNPLAPADYIFSIYYSFDIL